MRKSLTVSLSKSLVHRIKQIVTEHGFSSKSDFIRHTIYSWIEKNSIREIEDTNGHKKTVLPGIGLTPDQIKELEEMVKS